MTDDIVKQLRTAVSSDMDEYDFKDDLMIDAAHEIIELRFEVSRLRGHLSDIADVTKLRDRELWEFHNARFVAKFMEGIE